MEGPSGLETVSRSVTREDVGTQRDAVEALIRSIVETRRRLARLKRLKGETMSKHRDDAPTVFSRGDRVRIAGEDDSIHLIGNRDKQRYGTVCGRWCQRERWVPERAIQDPLCFWTFLQATCIVCVARWSG